MSIRHHLSKLALGGFQVFDELTEIPIERLTLLYGPNSVGKSSVEDAMYILKRIWTRYPEAKNQEELAETLTRHWRRTSHDPNSMVPVMQLNATFRTPIYLNEVICITTGCELKEQRFYDSEQPIESFELRTVFHRDSVTTGRTHQREILADNVFLLGITQTDEYSVNFAHPALNPISVASDFGAAAKSAPKLFSAVDGVVKLASRGLNSLLIDGDNSLTKGRRVTEFVIEHPLWAFDELEHASALACTPAIEEFFLFLNALEDIVASYANFDMDVVPASRRVPTGEDLTFLVSPPQSAQSLFGMKDTGDKRYRAVGESFVCPLRGKAESEPGADATDPPLAFEAVNAFLSDHLFVERGYRIGFDYRAVLLPNEFSAIGEGELDKTDLARRASYLVRMHLLDVHGREFPFEDVGSGLGYALPVLCSLSGPHVPFVMLQQPELHLHPALQAAMGDVLIDATNKDGCVLVETHSEHLLLRILKRIRQTHNGTDVSSDLKIGAGDLSVLYFEPMPDGTTSVRRLRVSDDGEFMDRWPRGFFAERDQELFDE